jgi:tRNA pseudouridine55 synthase
MTPGIHLVHKPVGPTSFSLVRDFKSAQKDALKICHGGTLDPFASGLLLILIEPATQLFDYLHDIPKIYEATVRWGVETDNGDPHGKVIFNGDASSLSPQQLDDAIKTFIGWHDQIPHATSNKRIGGERAYVRAHRGEEVSMPPSKVYLHEANWLSHGLPQTSQLRLTARGGYYVRALARDLGRLLGCGAHLSQLHRTAIGPWSDPGPDRIVELHGHEILPWAVSRILTDQDVGELRQARSIPRGDLRPPDWNVPVGFPEPQALIRAFHRDRLSFLLKAQDDRLEAINAFRGGS